MVGELFTINAINVARAAQREVERRLHPDAPVDITVGSRTNGYEQLFIRISPPTEPAIEIDVDDAAVRTCLAQDEPGAARRMASELIDGLADQIRAAVPVADLGPPS